MTFTETPDTFLQDFGVAVVSGSMSGVGILDQADQVFGEKSISTEYLITVKASIFSAIRSGAAVSVAGTNYTLREYRALDDGTFATMLLSKT